MKLQHKRGDSFFFNVTAEEMDARDKPTGPFNLNGVVITAQMRLDDALIYSFDVNVVDSPNGHYTISAPAADSIAWPPLLMDVDIQYVLPSGLIQSTQTFQLQVMKDVTR